MKKRGVIFILLALSFILLSLNFVAAVNTNTVLRSPIYINNTLSAQINITVNQSTAGNIINITKVVFIIPSSALYTYSSNETETFAGALSVNFTNSTVGSFTYLVFTNETADFLIANRSNATFLFNITPIMAGPLPIIINVSGTDGLGAANFTTIMMYANFAFEGYTKNETGGLQNDTNVSIYGFAQGQGVPPTETFLASKLTDEGGKFNFSSINGSFNQYKLKIGYYSAYGLGSQNITNVTKVSTILPPLPIMMFYPAAGIENIASAFMRPPTLNATTFYLEPGAPLNITAVGNHSIEYVTFGYEIMEQTTGFPIESNIMAQVRETYVAVPLNRNYTVMVLRGTNYSDALGPTICNGTFMNDTDCSTPPKSNATIRPTVAGLQVNIQLNLSSSRYSLSGCINVIGNTTNMTNITAVIPRLLPWAGFVPPVKDNNVINVTNKLVINVSNITGVGGAIIGNIVCPGKFAAYNISLISGDYLIEFYANNDTRIVGAGQQYLGAFVNVTISANTNLNFTLKPLAGSYNNSNGDVNTSKVKINIQNSTGGALTTDTPHVEVYLKNSSRFGELHYIIETMANGSFYVPLPRGADAKIKIFSNQAPPVERTINLSLAENNFTLVTMMGGDAGFRKFNSTGGLDVTNVTASPINMKFLINSTACNVLVPASTCLVTEMNATDFNPLKVMVAGKVNMKMTMINSGVSITFMNFDIFSAKGPPMNTIMNENASSRTTATSTFGEVWQFGSFVPRDVYSYALVEIPYNGTPNAANYINDSWNIDMKIPTLYDENWNVIWNKSAGDTANTLIADYIDYNNSIYADYLRTGVDCSKTDFSFASTPCYVNITSNVIYMKVPHFSGISPTVRASIIPAAEAAAVVTPSGGSAFVSPVTYNTVISVKSGVASKITPSSDIATATGLIEITITPTKDASNVKVMASTVSESAVATKLSNVYKYISVSVENLQNADISKAEIKFEVTKAWITDNNYDKDTVKLNRYVDNVWSVLTTSLVSETSTAYVYKSTVLGFSTFAITAEKAAAEVTPTTIPIVEKAKSTLLKYWWILAIIVAIIIIIAAMPKKRK